jgi:preprotein translocase subunit SecD
VQRRDWIYLWLILLLVGLSLWLNLAQPAIAFWRPVPAPPENATPDQIAEAQARARAIRSTALRLGLDLQGGMQVILEARGDASVVNPQKMETARNIISDRVNPMVGYEAVVQRQGERRLVVELPGVFDPQEALAAMQRTGFLEFVDTNGEILPEGMRITTTHGLSAEQVAAITGTRIYRTVLTGADLDSREIRADSDPTTQEPIVALGFNAEGTRIFAEWTSAHVNQPLAIVLDKKVISCPIVQEPITNGKASIRGEGIDRREAQRIATLLRYGALPVELEVVENRTVGPTLGQDSVNRSVIAGIIGLCTVLVFMTLYYRLPGVVASVALCIYTLLIFALYRLIPVTLTLPGIAGLLLSIGMAVDANILIFERMKEELRAGKSLRTGIEAGFDRAWTSIWDSNLSTLLTCAILYAFGSSLGASIVKGFAITLFFGVIVSMFSAITVTRTFLRLLYHTVGSWMERGSRLLLGVAVETR